MLDERMLFEAMRHATQMLALGTTVDIAVFTLAKVVVPTQRGAGRINRNATFEGGRHVRSDFYIWLQYLLLYSRASFIYRALTNM